MIDVNENKMGTALVDDNFLSRAQMSAYVNDHDDSVTIRCRIHVFDEQQMEAIIPLPTNFPPALPGVQRRPDGSVDRTTTPNRRRTRRDADTAESVPAKRRRL